MEKLTTKMPSVLYRYYAWKDGLEFLATKQLKLSTVTRYNDPFEFFPASKHTDKLSNLTEEELRKYIENNIKKYNGQISFSDVSKVSLASLAYAGTAGVLSFGTLLPIAAVAGGLAAIWDEYKESNNEELNRLKVFVENYLSFLGNIKTCCFSEICDSILMWSHYADKHQGVVIGFKTSILYWKDELFKNITYSDKRVQIPLEESNSSEFVNELITTKAKCWEYEKEWRLVKYNAQEINSVEISPELIDSIYIGLRVPNEACESILSIRDAFYKDVKVKRAYKSNDSFDLEFKEL